MKTSTPSGSTVRSSCTCPPKQPHQIVVAFLLRLLGQFIELFRLGVLLPAPFEMRAIPEGPAREPDLLFVAREHLDRFTEARPRGPAGLGVEVISDDSVAQDRADKFYEYQAAGVQEYWILDPRPGCTRADFYVLDGQGRYQPVPVNPDGRYYSTVLSGFWLQVDWNIGHRTAGSIAGSGPDRRPAEAAGGHRGKRDTGRVSRTAQGLALGFLNFHKDGTVFANPHIRCILGTRSRR